MCAGLAALTAIVLAISLVWTGTPPQTAADGRQRPNDVDAHVTRASATVSHPVYRYSVIPGGAHNRQELRDAIGRDPVVAAHYQTVSLDRVRVERLPEERRVYVSYRVGDRVFWTKHRVTLPNGEPILTDGVQQIRARCGNGISSEPQRPTSDTEPDVLEFEALAPSGNETLPRRATTLGWIPPAVAPIGRAARSVVAPALPSEIAQSGSRPFVNGTGLSDATATHARRKSVVPIPEEPAQGSDGHTPESAAPGDSIPGSSFPGSVVSDGSLPDGHTPDSPGDHLLYEPVPGTLIPRPTPGAGAPGDDPSRDALVQPVPVPEPSTVVLLGTGVAGVLWRRVRSRRRNDSTQR